MESYTNPTDARIILLDGLEKIEGTVQPTELGVDGVVLRTQPPEVLPAAVIVLLQLSDEPRGGGRQWTWLAEALYRHVACVTLTARAGDRSLCESGTVQ